jgi:pilus assembly protein CpaB
MRWAVIVLVILGLLAAVSAMILVGVLRTDSSGSADRGSSSNVEVVLAKTSLPAMSVITSKAVTKDTALKDTLPDGYLSSPVQAIGRVLAVPVVEGQVLTGSCFVTEGSDAQLAAVIPHGMRAVTITLSDRGITGGLLYPGCVVDVLASFTLSSQDRGRGQALSTTLLHGIQVLAVRGTSVVSKKDSTKGALEEKTAAKTRMTVTLMLDPKQAEALQLAMGYGSISLALRNPLDRYPVDVDSTVLSGGRLAKLGSPLTTAVLAARRKTTLLGNTKDSAEESQGDNIRIFTTRKEKGAGAAAEGYQTKPSPRWVVTVIRASEVRDYELDIPE